MKDPQAKINIELKEAQLTLIMHIIIEANKSILSRGTKEDLQLSKSCLDIMHTLLPYLESEDDHE